MMRCTLTVVCLLALFVPRLRGQDSRRNVFGRCIIPLGMEEGKIPDDAITASSSYESKSVGPQNARIRQEKNGGAWCPKAQISSAIREYLEVDLTRKHLIAWTETQGRFGNGQGQEYAEAFFLEYWRDARWHQYKNLMGDRVLRGNSNTYLVEKQKLDLPFVASRVRFVPYSQHPRTVCMRVEIYGCVWEQSLMSYSAPKASSPGPAGWNVQDSSYDGFEHDSLLMDGLGQLTDGILGDLSETRSLSVMVGTNWVGWANRATVELIFRFQELRTFENCSLHVARIPELEVEAFSEVRVSFSIDGQNYGMEEEKLKASVDSSWMNADIFSTTIPLQARIGRLVKIELSLAAKWLLLSEVTFYTGDRNRSNDFYYSTDRSHRVEQDHIEGEEKWRNLVSSTVTSFNETGFYEIRENGSTPDAFPVGASQTYIGLVSGILTIIVLSLSCTVFLLKQRGRNKVALLQKHTALLYDSSTPGIAISPKDRKLSNTITSGLSLIRKPITVAATTDYLQNRTTAQTNSQSNANELNSRPHSTEYEKMYKLFSEEALALNEPNVFTCEAESYLGKSLSHTSSMTDDASFTNLKCNSSEFALPCAATYASKIMLQFQSEELNQRIHEGYYAATDILTIKKRELSSTSSPFTPLHIRNKGIRLMRAANVYHIPRISRHRLRILDKLGEGNVGLVHLCEAKGIITNSEAGSVENRQTVILRSLWRGVVDSIRLDFTEDMRLLATLRNPNVAKMIALVEEEPVGAVFEYSEFGELPSFLESYGITDNEASIINNPGSAFSFINQIASAMKYLESMNIAHCDLAARNCIVTRNLTIKVSDHAAYCNKYDHQYFIDESNIKIPLRWMPWEAVTMGKHSTRADVWSFAVTVWEIFTNCKEIPYANLTSAQVLENCDRCYRDEVVENKQIDGDDEKLRPQVPQRPNRCPDNLYRMMNRCWSKRIADRPNFVEIHRYLERLALD